MYVILFFEEVIVRPNDLLPLWLWVRYLGKISIGSKCRIERGAILDMR
jgi:hypothetical protein